MDEMIRDELLKVGEKKYASFSSKLLPKEHKPLIGVRLPFLRKFAKELVKVNDYHILLNDESTDIYFEEQMLRGMIIGYGTERENDIKEALIHLDSFVPQIDNWSVCDSFCSSFKIAARYREEVFSHIRFFMSFGQEYTIRASLVLYMDHFLKRDENGKYINRAKSVGINDLIEEPGDNQVHYPDMFDTFISDISRSYEGMYYAQMGAAWFLAEAFCTYPKKIYEYLCNEARNVLDDRTFNYTIKKICESKVPETEVKARVKRILA